MKWFGRKKVKAICFEECVDRTMQTLVSRWQLDRTEAHWVELFIRDQARFVFAQMKMAEARV